MKHPWQLKYLKIPSNLITKISSFKDDNIIVACVKKIPFSDIEKGDYSHIGINLHEDVIEYPNKIVPNKINGVRSRRNVEGHQFPLKEQGKVWKTFSHDTPNFGDASKGYHEVTRDRLVYNQKIIPPKFLEIDIKLIHENKDEEECIFKFQVNRVYNRKTDDFDEDLLFAINLLQENVGCSDVFKSDATLKEFLRETTVNWEILPPGERESNLAIITSGRKVSESERREIGNRYDFLVSLGPKEIITGTSGFHRYFGGKFDDNLVVFENVSYGNAIYIMYEDWEKLSKRSRTELLSDPEASYDRIIHNQNWQRRLLRKLKERREDLFGKYVIRR